MTPRSAGLSKGVDGGPSPAMTGSGFRASTEAVIFAGVLSCAGWPAASGAPGGRPSDAGRRDFRALIRLLLPTRDFRISRCERSSVLGNPLACSTLLVVPAPVAQCPQRSDAFPGRCDPRDLGLPQQGNERAHILGGRIVRQCAGQLPGLHEGGGSNSASGTAASFCAREP
jgi:hypothetical protein